MIKNSEQLYKYSHTLNQLDKIIYLFQEQKEFSIKEKIDLEKKIINAKEWINKKPEYLKFLQHLQHVLQEKNIGLFSSLLTYFVQDVLKKDKSILFELYTYHNLPALKIEASNNGKKENIYEGNGGSIANIVSTGLRLIALSRMQNRKFIILDEPDCWLETAHIPLFAKIIGEISQKLKIQTVLISHHSWEYFKSYGRVIELKPEGKILTTNILHDTEVSEYPKDYITSVRMQNLMSHTNTLYELHPYLTCIVGTNDIGKSVLSPAFKALAYGDSSDSYISHYAHEAKVTVSTNQKLDFLWERFETTNSENPQKVKFSLFEDNKLVVSEFNAHESPSFIKEKLNIKMVEDIDVHIGNQKEPIFLLSSSVKPQERAKILSLGKESLILQKSMEHIKQKTKNLQTNVKENEISINKHIQQIDILENIEEIKNKFLNLQSEIPILNNKELELIELNNFINQFEIAESATSIGFISENTLNISKPNLVDCSYLNLIIFDLNKHEAISIIPTIETTSYSHIKLNDLKEIIDLISNIQKLESIEHTFLIEVQKPNFEFINLTNLNNHILDIENIQDFCNMKNIQIFDKPDLNLNEISEFTEFIKEIIKEDVLIKKFDLELQKNQEYIKNIETEEESYLSKYESKCPTCKQTISKDHFLSH